MSRVLIIIIFFSILYPVHLNAIHLSDKIKILKDISYSDSSNEAMDIYLPCDHSSKKNIVLIYIHGGGWMFGDKSRTIKHGLFYAKHGIIFITLNYRLAPDYLYPASIEDCAEAINWIFYNIDKFGGDKNRIFISGHSAGAHLAALLVTNEKYLSKYNISPKEISGVILVDGASYNLLSTNRKKLIKILIKKAFGKNRKILKDGSPFYNINPRNICRNFLVFNTQNRKTAVIEARKFVQKLKKASVKVNFITIKDKTHGEMNKLISSEDSIVSNNILKFLKLTSCE